ncbi:hypothetical protein HanIR_Chr13g0639631 [Helianthus annuus]|nr:hypothetical protein HanIR_Chr13g0639631 [Helianthus annuus]
MYRILTRSTLHHLPLIHPHLLQTNRTLTPLFHLHMLLILLPLIIQLKKPLS